MSRFAICRSCRFMRCARSSLAIHPVGPLSPSSGSIRLYAAGREQGVDVPKELPTNTVSRQPRTKPQLRDRKIGFLGWGAMAQAVSLGILREELTDPDKMMAADPVPEMLEVAEREGLRTTCSNKEVVEWADVVMMAVKPQVIDVVLEDIAPAWKPEKLMVSIVAGVSIKTLEEGLGSNSQVVRVMPNTPSLVGEAATAYAGNQHCGEWNLGLVYEMFAAVGRVTHRVPEPLMNTVTGLSGSGPAYVYMLINALSDAGVHGGLPRAVALSLASQTVVGAARMVQSSGQHPMVLKEQVTSPGGTTIAGVRALEMKGFPAAVLEAVDAAAQRSAELAKPTKTS